MEDPILKYAAGTGPEEMYAQVDKVQAFFTELGMPFEVAGTAVIQAYINKGSTPADVLDYLMMNIRFAAFMNKDTTTVPTAEYGMYLMATIGKMFVELQAQEDAEAAIMQGIGGMFKAFTGVGEQPEVPVTPTGHRTRRMRNKETGETGTLVLVVREDGKHNLVCFIPDDATTDVDVQGAFKLQQFEDIDPAAETH